MSLFRSGMGLAGFRKYFPFLESRGYPEGCFLKAIKDANSSSLEATPTRFRLAMEQRLCFHAASKQSHVAGTQITPTMNTHAVSGTED